MINVGSSSGGSGNNLVTSLKEILDDFMKQQMAMEMQWLKAYEAKEEERRIKEMEWRQTMEALENERLMLERRWREREEQRKVREEARAEKRDDYHSSLNKLRREDHCSLSGGVINGKSKFGVGSKRISDSVTHLFHGASLSGDTCRKETSLMDKKRAEYIIGGQGIRIQDFVFIWKEKRQFGIAT
ncbi:hypothetical protein HAX54_024954 [Datura stramonium]|uniref:Uncharacterized protein n=1 Tax=Datura stramonium TaxID=4076 RepID=A0ABS8V0Q5_DATST|nr:hypothetical protein [Datura stramonium]